MVCPRRCLPPARILAKDEVPESVGLGFYGNEKATRDEQVLQAGEGSRIEPQACTGIYRYDNVESCPVQTVIPIAR